MKTRFLFSIILTGAFLFYGATKAQNFKDLKKVKDKVEKNVPASDNKSSKSSSSSSSSSNSGSNKAPLGGGNNSFDNFINEKRSLISDYDYGLSIYDLEKGNFKMDSLYVYAKVLDYPATVKRIKENKLASGYKAQDVLDYGKKFENAFESAMQPTINRWIDEAYKEKQYNEKNAIGKVKNAKELAEVCTWIMPDNTTASSLYADAKKAFDDLAGKYYATLYTSNFHKDNAGKVLFSKTPIIIGKEDPNQFTDQFTANDNIYAIAYLNARIGDLGNEACYEININGNNSYINFKHNEEDKDKSYYIIEIIPDPAVAVHGLDAREFGKLLANLSPRTHNFQLTFTAGYSNKQATGAAKLDWAGVDAAKIKANAEAAEKNARDNWARNLKLPEVFSRTTTKFADPDLTDAKIKSMYMTANKEVVSIEKMIITEPYSNYTEDWVINKNSAGIPTDKTTTRYTYIVYKGKDGWCYFTEAVFFRRDYKGGGKYTAPRICGFDRKTRIDCKNVK